MDYNDPNDYWQGYDPYKGMTDDERMLAGCLHVVGGFIVIVIMLLLCALFGSCTTTKYVTVPEVHEHWHHQTDTIMRTDSIIDHQQIIIREVDSATMAQYGIELKDMQRAWLIENSRLRKQLSELMQSRADTTIVHDSIPVPYPVEVKVPAELTQWQQIRISLANLLRYAIGALVGWLLLKKVL